MTGPDASRRRTHERHLSKAARGELNVIHGLLVGKRGQLMTAGKLTVRNYSLLAANETVATAVASLRKLRHQYEALRNHLAAEALDTSAAHEARHRSVAALSAYIACISELEKAAGLGGSPLAAQAVRRAAEYLTEARKDAALAATALDAPWPI